MDIKFVAVAFLAGAGLAIVVTGILFHYALERIRKASMAHEPTLNRHKAVFCAVEDFVAVRRSPIRLPNQLEDAIGNVVNAYATGVYPPPTAVDEQAKPLPLDPADGLAIIEGTDGKLAMLPGMTPEQIEKNRELFRKGAPLAGRRLRRPGKSTPEE